MAWSRFSLFSKDDTLNTDQNASTATPPLNNVTNQTQSSSYFQSQRSSPSLHDSDYTRTPYNDDESTIGQPSTPMGSRDRRSSMRSILREPNTPGTGQNVRFIGRDAFRVITPSQSSNERTPSSLDQSRTQRMNNTTGSEASVLMSLQDTPSQSSSQSLSLSFPTSPQNESSPFETSMYMAPIPHVGNNTTAILTRELTEFDSMGSDAQSSRQTSFQTPRVISNISTSSTSVPSPTIYHEATTPSSSRTINKTLFHTPSADPAPELSQFPNKVDQPNFSTAVEPSAKPSPESTELIMAQSDLIRSLQEQLAVQADVSVQYEIELDSRDELVELLSERIEVAESELDIWRNDRKELDSTIGSLRKKITELQRICKHLQNEVDQSREQDLNRSLMDEASGQALRTLHQRISHLELAKETLEHELEAKNEQLQHQEADLGALKEKLAHVSDHAFQSSIEQQNELNDRLHELMLTEEQHEKQIKDMRTQISNLEKVNFTLQRDLESASSRWDEERTVLKNNAMNTQDTIEQNLNLRLLQQGEELERYKAEVESLRNKLDDRSNRMEESAVVMASVQTELDEVRAQLEEALNRGDNLEAEQQELEAHSKEMAGELEVLRTESSKAMQARDSLRRELDALNEEQHHNLDTITHLESVVREREEELDEMSQSLADHAEQVKNLQTRLSSVERDQRHANSEQQRRIKDLEQALQSALKEVDHAVRSRSEMEVSSMSLDETARIRGAELERLRRRVHELESESSKKEVRNVQLQKEIDGLMEDNQNMNIALDSKQQELALMKRRFSVKGTGGATPAPKRASNKSSRESLLSSTSNLPSERPLSRSSKISVLASSTSSATPSAAKLARLKAPSPIQPVGKMFGGSSARKSNITIDPSSDSLQKSASRRFETPQGLREKENRPPSVTPRARRPSMVPA